MKRNVRMTRSVATGWAVLATVLGCQAATATATSGPGNTSRPDLGPDSSVMVVPVLMAGGASKEVAHVLGVLLEQEGMPNVYLTGAAFTPEEGADAEQVAAAFGPWVATQDFETQYVLFAQVMGSPARGVDAVRAILVDQKGALIWNDDQTAEDPAFRKSKPSNPMSCCVFLAERVGPQFQLSSATRGRVKDGRLEQLGRAQSGMPSAEQVAAMETRAAALKQKMGDSRLVIYPVQSNSGSSAEQTTALVSALGKQSWAKCAPAKTALTIDMAPTRNQQKRLWDLARGFRAHVLANKPDVDYALVADYVIRPDNGQVWAVNFVICDRAGDWVIVDFQNNHHDDFNAIAPKTADDCADLVSRRLAGYLK